MSQLFHPTQPRSRRGFIERTLVAINQTLEQSVFAEQIARQSGLLQALDPRFKVVAMLVLLMAASLSRQLSVLVGLYLFTLLLAGASKIPVGFFIKRVWAFIALFTGIIALPALFITPGPVLVAHLPWGLVITRTGALSALFLLLRVGASVSLAVLFVLTTPWNSLLKALGVLHVPDVLILTLGMTYRYIHLLLHLANDMFLSRRSRVLRRMTGAQERRLLAATSATLLGKSLLLSSEVYLAMESRGYRGYPRTIDRFHLRRIDWAAGLVVVLVAVLAVWLGR